MGIADLEIDWNEVRNFPRKNPDCDHCGTVLLALEKWPQAVHDECDCLCHTWKSKRGKQEIEERKKQARKRKK